MSTSSPPRFAPGGPNTRRPRRYTHTPKESARSTSHTRRASELPAVLANRNVTRHAFRRLWERRAITGIGIRMAFTLHLGTCATGGAVPSCVEGAGVVGAPGADLEVAVGDLRLLPRRMLPLCQRFHSRNPAAQLAAPFPDRETRRTCGLLAPSSILLLSASVNRFAAYHGPQDLGIFQLFRGNREDVPIQKNQIRLLACRDRPNGVL